MLPCLPPTSQTTVPESTAPPPLNLVYEYAPEMYIGWSPLRVDGVEEGSDAAGVDAAQGRHQVLRNVGQLDPHHVA